MNLNANISDNDDNANFTALSTQDDNITSHNNNSVAYSDESIDGHQLDHLSGGLNESILMHMLQIVQKVLWKKNSSQSNPGTDTDLTHAITEDATSYVLKMTENGKIYQRNSLFELDKIDDNILYTKSSGNWSLQIRGTVQSGSFGAVHVATDIKSTCFVALKLVKKDEYPSPRYVAEEIRNMKSCQNQGVPAIYGYFSHDDKFYIVMEYLPGGSLNDFIGIAGVLSNEVICNFMRQLVSTVRYLGTQNILHRDIKPDNVLIGLENKLLISDFGFSIQSEDWRTTVLGSAYYQAPEIKPESKYHKAVDVYSLGKIFYQLVVGTSDEDEMSDVSDHAYYHTAIQYDRFEGHVFGNLIKSMLKESPKERATIDAICLKLSHLYSEFDQAAAYA